MASLILLPPSPVYIGPDKTDSSLPIAPRAVMPNPSAPSVAFPGVPDDEHEIRKIMIKNNITFSLIVFMNSFLIGKYLLILISFFYKKLKDIIMVFFPYMRDFSKRLRSEIEYIGLTQKEFAEKAGIKKRALDGYVRSQQSMPPADTAVKIAAALGLSVEYLVTGSEYRQSVDISGYLQFRDLLDDLTVLPDETLNPIKAVIRAFAENERKKQE